MKRDWTTAEIEALHRADAAQIDLIRSLGFDTPHRTAVAGFIAEAMLDINGWYEAH